jgi:hypothetical protein
MYVILGAMKEMCLKLAVDKVIILACDEIKISVILLIQQQLKIK